MQALLKTLEAFKTKQTIEVDLKSIGSWAETTHIVEKNDILAMIAGLGSERAILLTGDPGVGKSHLARVAAELTDRFFMSAVIKPDDEIDDLLWSIDHVQRLSDAQLAAANKEEFKKPLEDYIRPGPIWHAFQEPESKLTGYKPPAQDNDRKNGVVLLLDEIDKASVSLLNSLLEVLGNMSFEVPLYDKPVECRDKPPLIILTSNGDRELPEPLLRRCVCHTLQLPKSRDAFIERMCVIAKAKKGEEKYSEKVAVKCAELIYSHRKENEYSSGASEFVDLINTLESIAPNDANAQIKHLANIQQYFLKS